ncbi:MAG: hypothetical protein QXS27_00075 [Candidatus Jordarchaeaceae archaeon]
MYSQKPRSINVIVVGLLLNALVYLYFAFNYLAILHNPLPYFLEGSDYSIASAAGIILAGGWEWIQLAIALEFIIRGFYFQWLTGLLVYHIVFYALLIASIPVLIFGLLRRRNWARIATIAYSIIILVFLAVTILPQFRSGPLNMGFLDLLYIGTSELYIYLHSRLWVTTPLVSAAVFSVYLSADEVKHQFK